MKQVSEKKPVCQVSYRSLRARGKHMAKLTDTMPKISHTVDNKGKLTALSIFKKKKD